MMKHYMHFIAPLALWAIALALYIVTVTHDLPHKVDAVKVYQLQKKPHVFEDAWFNIRDAFTTYWPSDTCYTLTDLSGSASCATQRSALATSILSNLECTKYNSQVLLLVSYCAITDTIDICFPKRPASASPKSPMASTSPLATPLGHTRRWAAGAMRPSMRSSRAAGSCTTRTRLCRQVGGKVEPV